MTMDHHELQESEKLNLLYGKKYKLTVSSDHMNQMVTYLYTYILLL